MNEPGKASTVAEFRRADLHIHTFGPLTGSYDVEDPTMTVEAIVSKARAFGIDVIAIADHNRVGNVGRAIEAGTAEGVYVVPAVELSTPQGHLLVYAPTLDALTSIVGRLEFDEKRRACRSSMFQCLKTASDFGGLGIAAHIDRPSGLEKAVSGNPDAKRSVITSPHLAAVEIARHDNLDWYTHRDPDRKRKELLRARVSQQGDAFSSSIARIQSSDAHTLGRLGQNWEEREKLTRLKMSRLDWPSFRAAFADHEARVRIEELLPSSVPRIGKLKVRGGFLDQQEFQFSRNLSTIIGGRGSGKSTTLALVLALCGNRQQSGLTESDIWPSGAEMSFTDANGVLWESKLDSFGEVEIRRKDTGEIRLEPIAVESLGQGEMAEIIRDCGHEPEKLLRFLDTLISLDNVEVRVSDARVALVENGKTVTDLELVVQPLGDVKKTLEFKTRQEEEAEARNTPKLISLQRNLAEATTARQGLIGSYDTACRTLLQRVDHTVLSDLEDLAQVAGSLISTDEGDDVIQPSVQNPISLAIEKLRPQLTSTSTGWVKILADTRDLLTTLITNAETQQTVTRKEIEVEVEKLRVAGIRPDLRFLKDLSDEIAKLKRKVDRLEKKGELLKSAHKQRTTLLSDYHAACSERTALRKRFSRGLTAKLREFLVDWKISLKFKEGLISKDAESALAVSMGWRTTAVPKSTALIQNLGVPALIEAIQSGDIQTLEKGCQRDGRRLLKPNEAQAIVDRMAQFQYRRQLEECLYEDYPYLTVTRRAQPNEGAPIIVREFQQLSLGQQQSIVLAVLLCSNSTKPLILDQPEDNLDSAFIFQILVRALRQIKEMRQVIIVTHNANICVLSDSDTVLPLKASATRSMIRNAGTVESPQTRDLVCEILEGGSSAYTRRGEIYHLLA